MSPPSSALRPRLVGLIPLAAGILLALFLVGLRWDIVGRFASDLPVWDQWDAEGLHLLAPWKEDRPVWPEIFRPHNEHRVVLTKLVNLALTAANGCWDQRLECVFNALLPAAIAALLFLQSRRFCPLAALPAVWLMLALGWGLPLAWQNMVTGFHSQQFFLIGLSYGAISLLPFAPSWSKAWWLGAACAVLALGSMASGFFAALVVIGLLGWQLVRREMSGRQALPALGVALAVIVVGLSSRVSVEYHEGLKAHTLQDFFLTLWHSLQWPVPQPAWLALLVWAPWAWLAAVVLKQPRGLACRDGLLLLGLGGWVLLQLVATAYVRGAGGLPPPHRYVDTLFFGAVINAFSLGWLATRGSAASRTRGITLAALAAIWLAVTLAGAVHHVRQGWVELRSAAAENLVAETNTRHFLLTDNTRHLETKGIPYPDFNSFIPLISRPSLRSLMPASVRPPLEMTPDMHQGFSREKITDPSATSARGLPAGAPPLLFEPFWSSWNETGPRNTGEWTSIPLRTDAGWIKLQVAGTGDPAEVALEIRDMRMGLVLAVIHPPPTPDVWQTTYVRISGPGFVVAGIDRSASGWLAFSAPVEVHALSYFAILATRTGWLLARLAAGGALLVAVLALLAKENPRPAGLGQNQA